MRVGIIGGGASGVMCAIKIKQLNPNIEVTIIERENKIGSKLAKTGAGKGNVLNRKITSYSYNNFDFVSQLLEITSIEEIIKTFTELGLFLDFKDNLAYPYSNQAIAINRVLENALYLYNVKVVLNTLVTKIEKKGDFFAIKDEFEFDKVVVSIGGPASVKDYNNDFLRAFKINFVEFKPGLSGFMAPIDKRLDGLRIKSSLSYYIDEIFIREETGELQFKNDGISGICAMNLNRYYQESKENLIRVSFIPFDFDGFMVFINSRLKFDPNIRVRNLFVGLINLKLNDVIFGLDNREVSKLDEASLFEIFQSLKEYPIKIDKPYPLSNAQVSLGGVDVNSLNKNLSFISEPNLYMTGEVLNIDGICGGYNLTFAFLCGICVAKDIVK